MRSRGNGCGYGCENGGKRRRGGRGAVWGGEDWCGGLRWSERDAGSRLRLRLRGWEAGGVHGLMERKRWRSEMV